MFDELCVKAIELLMDETDDITMRMMSRKIKNIEISMPVPREEDEEESNAEYLVERSVVPNKFIKALESLESKPMFSRNKFMLHLINLTGGVDMYTSQMKASEHSDWTQRKHLDISWIDVVVKAVFQRPADAKYVRYGKDDIEELVEEILALHEAVSG